jgi:hypothetical protein
MMAALRLHIAANMICLRRNRLLHAFMLLVAVGAATVVVPALAFGDTSDRFEPCGCWRACCTAPPA